MGLEVCWDGGEFKGAQIRAQSEDEQRSASVRHQSTSGWCAQKMIFWMFAAQ